MSGFRDARWRKLKSEDGPEPLEDHTWTVDATGDYAYLFGGRDGRRESAALWRYDLAEDTWKKLRPDGPRPGERFGHSAVWAPGRGLVIFAGQQGVDFLNDVWIFDPERGRWRQQADQGATPRKRYGSCAVIDTDGRLRISHGFTFAGRFADTRTYDFDRERWRDVTPDGRLPGERCLPDCFTTATGEMVLYGGQDDSNRSLGDLWSQRPNGTWQNHDDPRPRARRLYAVAEAGRNAFIFGGAAADGTALDDTWRVDRETLRFSPVRTTGPTPPGRSAGTLIADVKRDRLLLFGGEGDVARADLWQLTDRSSGTSEAPSDTDAGETDAAAPDPIAEAPEESPAAA